MKNLSFLLWYVAIGMCVVIITNHFFGDGWESWLLGLVIFGALAPFIPRFLERRRKLMETDDAETDVDEPRGQHLLREVNTSMEGDTNIQRFLQAMNLTIEQVDAMNEAELRAVVDSYHQRQRTLSNDTFSGSKNYYSFLRAKGLKPGQAKALSNSGRKSLKREYRRWRDSS
jgi:hypothetical protein